MAGWTYGCKSTSRSVTRSACGRHRRESRNGRAATLEATARDHGNIDDAKTRLEFPADQRFTIEGVRVWMTHIGGRPPRYDPAVRDELKRDPPTLFICGHSHICMVKFDPALNMLYMNPGATGRHGWHKVRTALRFTIDGPKLKDLEVIELGARGAGENLDEEAQRR